MSQSDITLTVGADVNASYDLFKSDIQKLVKVLNANPPKIKVQLDTSSILKMRRQLDSVLGAMSKAQRKVALSSPKIKKQSIDNGSSLSKDEQKLRNQAIMSSIKRALVDVKTIRMVGKEKERAAENVAKAEARAVESVAKAKKKANIDAGSATTNKSAANKKTKKTSDYYDDEDGGEEAASAAIDRAIKGAKDRVRQGLKDLDRWTEAKSGSSKSYYKGYQDDISSLERYIEALERGQISLKEFQFAYTELEKRMASSKLEMTRAKEDMKSILDVEKENAAKMAPKRSEYVKRAYGVIGAGYNNLNNWTASKNGTTSAYYNRYKMDIEALHQLAGQLKTGLISVQEFDAGFKKIQATLAISTAAIKRAGEATGDLNEKMMGKERKRIDALEGKRDERIIAANKAEAGLMKDLDKFSPAKNGKSSKAYSGFVSDVGAFKALNEELRKGTILVAEYDAKVAGLKRSMSDYKLEMEKSGELTKEALLEKERKRIDALEDKRNKRIVAANKEEVRLMKDLESFSFAKKGKAGGAYDNFSKDVNAFKALNEELRKGTILVAEYDAKVEGLKASMSNYKLEMEKSGFREDQKAQSEASSKKNAKNDSLSRGYNLVQTGYTNLEKWTAAESGKSKESYATYKKSVQELESLTEKFKAGKISLKEYEEGFKSARKTMAESALEVKKVGENTSSLKDRIGSLASQFAQWFTAARLMMHAVNTVKQMTTASIELDSAMTELKKVTDETDFAYDTFLNNAAERSKKIGASLVDTVRATSDFARLGYDIKDAEKLADAASIYKNVGDGIGSVEEASSSIIAVMQAFGVSASDTMSIVDKFNEVGNNFAISSAGIGQSLIRSAAAMKSANNTLDETIALATAANTIVQDPEKVGTTLKTVSMFLRASKTEAEEAGESTEGMAESVSKLRDELLQLTGNKVDIQLDDKTFKSTYQIIKELASVWHELSDVSRANILERIGGKRNANVVAGLLENFKIAEEALKVSRDESEGSALEENKKQLESIQGRINVMKASFQTLSKDIMNGDMLKFLVNSATAFLDFSDGVTKLVGDLGGLKNILIAITGIQISRNFYQISKLMSNVLSAGAKKISGLFDEIGASILYFTDGFNGAKKAGKGFISSIMGGLGTMDMGAKILLITAAITVAVKAIDHFTHSFTRAAQKADEAAQEYYNAQSELKSLNTQYDEQTERIKELQALKDNGSITMSQEVELENLINQNKTLEQQIALQKQLLDVKQQSSAKTALDASLEEKSYMEEMQEEHGNVAGWFVAMGKYLNIYGRGWADVKDWRDMDTTQTGMAENYLKELATLEDKMSKVKEGLIKYPTNKKLLKKQEELDEDILDTRQDMQKTSLMLQQWIKQSTDEFGRPLDGMVEYVDKWRSALTNIQNYGKSVKEVDFGNLEGYFSSASGSHMKKYLEDIVKNGGTAKDALKAFRDAGMRLEDIDVTESGFVRYFNDIEDAAKDAKEAIEAVDGSFDGVNKAFESKNQGANYDTMLGYFKKSKELNKNGLWGTDDFKTIAQFGVGYSIADRLKSNADAYKYASDAYVEAYNNALPLLERWYGNEEELVNMHNILADFSGKGLARSLGGDEYSFKDDKGAMMFKSTAQAAIALGTSVDNVELAMSKLKEHGFEFDGVEYSGKQLDRYRTNLEKLHSVVKEMDEGSRKDRIMKLLPEWDSELEKFKDPNYLATLTEDQILKIEFEYDIAQLQQQLNEAMELAQATGENRDWAAARIIAKNTRERYEQETGYNEGSGDGGYTLSYQRIEELSSSMAGKSEEARAVINEQITSLMQLQNAFQEFRLNGGTLDWKEFLKSDSATEAFDTILKATTLTKEKIAEALNIDVDDLRFEVDADTSKAEEKIKNIDEMEFAKKIAELTATDNATPYLRLWNDFKLIPQFAELNAVDQATYIIAYWNSLKPEQQEAYLNGTLNVTDNATGTVVAVTDLINKIPLNPKATLEATDYVTSAVSGARGALADLNGTSAHTYIYQHTVPVLPGLPGNPFAQLAGTAHVGGTVGGLYPIPKLSSRALAMGTLQDDSWLKSSWKTKDGQVALTGELGTEIVVDIATLYGNIYEKFYLIAGNSLESCRLQHSDERYTSVKV